MLDTKTEWKLEEYKVYLFFYCADADFKIKWQEEEFISNYAEAKVVNRIREAFYKDGEYARTQKIREGAEQFQFTAEEQGVLMSEILDLFLCDDDFHRWEKKLMVAVHELIRP